MAEAKICRKWIIKISFETVTELEDEEVTGLVEDFIEDAACIWGANDVDIKIEHE